MKLTIGGAAPGGLDYYYIAHSAQWVLEALGLGSTTRNSSCAVVVRLSSFSSQNVQNITLTHSSLYLAIPFHHCPSSLFMSFCMDQSSTPHQPFHSALISLVLLCVSGSLSTGHQPSPSYQHLHRPPPPSHYFNSVKTTQDGIFMEVFRGWILS
jgi:hypothetical protein